MSFNPVALVRELSSSPEHTRGVHAIVGRVAGGGSYTVTVETQLKSIISAIVHNETDAADVAPTIAASTDHPNTYKVSFSVANSKKYSYVIIGLYDRDATDTSIGGNTTITYYPVKGD